MNNTSSSSDFFLVRLRRARELRSLNQSELAEKTGLQPSAVSQFETGARKPSFYNLKLLADALDVTIDYLLGRVDDPAGFSGAERIHRNLERLTDSDRKFAEEMLEILASRAEQSDS